MPSSSEQVTPRTIMEWAVRHGGWSWFLTRKVVRAPDGRQFDEKKDVGEYLALMAADYDRAHPEGTFRDSS